MIEYASDRYLIDILIRRYENRVNNLRNSLILASLKEIKRIFFKE